MPFKPGQSGNPKGRKKGVHSKKSALVGLDFDKIIEVANLLIEDALKGDKFAMREVVRKFMPDAPQEFELTTRFSKADDISQTAQKILDAVLVHNEMTPDEGIKSMQMLMMKAETVDQREMRDKLEMIMANQVEKD